MLHPSSGQPAGLFSSGKLHTIPLAGSSIHVGLHSGQLTTYEHTYLPLNSLLILLISELF